MTNELERLVEGERREQGALAVSSMLGLGIAGVLATAYWSTAGLLICALGVVFGTAALHKRHQYSRLLDEKSQIDGVERATKLGRPALLVRFAGGSELMLTTWNVDRERVFELLQQRELPKARLLR